MQSSSPNPRHNPESGYVLLAVIFLTFLLLLSLAIAAPKIAMSIQRDKDLETIHRGEQYKRALQLYYRQFGSYPTSMDQLVSTNNMRFLRKRYTDPETGKDDWKPVYYGQAHVRPLGFFGQPLSAIGGIATAAVVGGMGSGMYALAPPTTTDAEGFPVSDNGSNTSSAPGSGPGMSSGPANGGPSSGTNNGTFSMGGQSNSGFNSGSGVGSNPGLGANGQTGIGAPGGTPTSGFGSSPSGFGSSNGSSGGTFGSGGPIVGFTLPVNKPSLVDYKLQSRYNKWEFNYDPMEDQMQQAAGLLGGGGGMSGTTGGMGTGGMNGTQGGFGNSNGLGGSNGLGNGNGFGGSNNNGFGQSGNGSSGSGSSGSGSSGSGTSGSDNSGSSNPPTPPQ